MQLVSDHLLQRLSQRGIRLEDPARVGAAWEQAFSADRPVVIDAVVDADVPTLPPSLTAEQRKKLARALEAGDPDAAGVRARLAESGYTL